MNDILARRARRATVGIALSAALVAGIAPATAIAAKRSAPTGAAVSQTSAANGNSGAPQTEDAAAAREKRMQPCRKRSKTSRPQKTPQVPRKLRDSMMTLPVFKSTAKRWRRKPPKGGNLLPTMQADIDAAQAKYDGAINRVSELQAELGKKHEMLKTLEALGYEEFVETISHKKAVAQCDHIGKNARKLLRNGAPRVPVPPQKRGKTS